MNDFYRVSVRVNEYDLTKDSGTVYEVEKFIQHHNYSISNGSDIGLIRLKESINFTELVTPVCLPVNETLPDYDSNTIMVVMGFGFTDNGSKPTELPTDLMKVEVPLVPFQECVVKHVNTVIKISDEERIRLEELHDGYLCAGALGRDAAKGN